MRDRSIYARFEEFSIAPVDQLNVTAAIPSVRAGSRFRGGGHAYYFYNFRTAKAVCVSIPHSSVILPGLRQFARANSSSKRNPAWLALFTKKFHYGFNLLEQIMLMTVPHTVVPVGEGRFIISLWSYCGCILVDLKKRTVTYKILDRTDDNSVLGARLWYETETNSILYMTYSLNDSMKRADNSHASVASRICRYDISTGDRQELWQGEFADYMHDIAMSKDRRYLVVCEMGRFLDKDKHLMPSRVLIKDLKGNREWIISEVANAAHVEFDPEDDAVLYFSNHNFLFEHTSLAELLKKRSYSLKFLGPASVHKFHLAEAGPVEQQVFSEPDLMRMTNFHVFRCQKDMLLAAMSAPNSIFIANSETMQLKRKIEILNPEGDTYIGTFCPSPDGQKLFVQTTRAFHVVDLVSGSSEFIHTLKTAHTCSNHMITSNDTAW